MTSHDNIVLGLRSHWGQEIPFSLSPADRRHHLFILGKTGAGKTSLVKNIIIQDMLAGRGVAFIDPHGQTAEELLDCVPRHRKNDLVYFNPADTEYPIAWNPLSVLDARQKPLVVDGIVSALRSIWRDSWGQRLEHFLSFALATLADYGDATLLDVSPLLADPKYRAHVLPNVKDPVILRFWTDEFARYDQRFLSEAVAPIHNRLGQLALNPAVRNILGQRATRVRMRDVMDTRKIFIANLAKGAIGEGNANLLGALLVTQFQQAAMSRIDTPEPQRVDFHVAIDEFHNFGTDAFASILSEARKFALPITLVSQFVDQVPELIQRAIFGNIGSLVSFRIGERDAEVLRRQFGTEYRADTFTGLDNFHVLAKLLTNGKEQAPFLGQTLPPYQNQSSRRAGMIARSRYVYARPRAVVEARLARASTSPAKVRAIRRTR